MRKALLGIALMSGVVSWSQMTTQGTAFQMADGCDCYEITSSTNDNGAIWSPVSIDLTIDFDMTFDIYMGSSPGGADGMVFVLQTTGFGVGTVGNTLAWNGITPSVGWEIDTWNSGISAPGDIAADHLAMASNGSNSHNLVSPVALGEMEDGVFHTMQITWDESLDQMAVYLDGALTAGYVGDITAILGTSDAYFGFTGSTGGAWNVQRVCMSREADFTADATEVCKGTEVAFTDASTSSLNNITNWDWDFGDGSTSTDQNPTHTWSTDGTMSVVLTITDASGCTDTYGIDIEVLPDLDVDSTVHNIACHGDSTGQATAIPVSGTGPYTYSWDDADGQTTSDATNLGPGTYTCIVTDDLGCTGMTTVTITEASGINISAVTSMDDGTTNGAIDISVSGGTPSTSGYTYSWAPDGETTEDLSGLSAGDYTVTVTDSLGCSEELTFTVGSSVGIVDLANGANVYPNPTTGLFTIETNGTFEVVITDIAGKLILQEEATDESQYDLSDMEAGVYIVKIKKNDSEIVQQLVLK